jgi:hypothetical protein
MHPIQWVLLCAVTLASSLGFAALGDVQEHCPDQAPGRLAAEATLVDSEPGELEIAVVLRNEGDGPVLIYPYLVPRDCYRAGGPYLYLSVAITSEDGSTRSDSGVCSGYLRDPTGFEFLPLLPGDFLGRTVRLYGESFGVPRLPAGEYDLELSVSTEARSYLKEHRPKDLCCSSGRVFQGELSFSPLHLAVP